MRDRAVSHSALGPDPVVSVDPPTAPAGTAGEAVREHSFGEGYDPTVVDRLGVWLSGRRVRRAVGTFDGKRVADVGCGYHASFARSVLDRVAAMTLIDVSISPELAAHPRVRTIEGALPTALDALADASVDVVVCNSVLEHLWEAQEAIVQMRRVSVPGGVVLLNVPTWRGKRFLELAAFRLGLSPADEMNDHKTYYDPEDLWPLLVRAGFRPQNIRCFRHKLGLNTFAICRR